MSTEVPGHSVSHDGDRRDVIIRLMALLELRGVGPAGVNRLIRTFGSARALALALENHDSASFGAAGPYFRHAIAAWAGVELERYASRLAQTLDRGDDVVFVDDEHYPENLRGVRNTPPVLYVRGSLARLSSRALALVGSVDPTERGLARAEKFAGLCARHGIQVISGLARGIDGASHRAALAGGNVTYAVLGHGLSHLYPSEHAALAREIAREGALISQFAPETPPSRWTFPARNELMCTLAQGTVIIEIERTNKLGSVIQARFSIKHGRPVFVLRSNIIEIGSVIARSLVESGDAVEVADFADVLDRLGQSNTRFALPADKPSSTTPRATRSKPRKRRAVILDLDGVVYDPRSVLTGSYVEAMKACGKGDVTETAIRALLHMSPAQVYRRFGVPSGQARPVFQAAYGRLLEATECVFEPVTVFVRRARDLGFAIGVVTSQPRSRCDLVLRRAGLADVVDASISWNDVPSNKQKPNPEPLFRVLSALSVSPEDAVYIGDTPNDVLAARGAGVKCVAVTWGLSGIEALRRFAPDIIATDFQDLNKLLGDIPSAA